MSRQELVVLLIALWNVLAAARLSGRRLLPLRWAEQRRSHGVARELVAPR